MIGFALLADISAGAMQAARNAYTTIPFDRVVTYSGAGVRTLTHH